MMCFDCVDLTLMEIQIYYKGHNQSSNNSFIIYRINMTSSNDGSKLSRIPSGLTTPFSITITG